MSEKGALESGRPRHEKRDISVGKVALFGFGLVVVIIVVGIVVRAGERLHAHVVHR